MFNREVMDLKINTENNPEKSSITNVGEHILSSF